jgi:hypothetical protein
MAQSARRGDAIAKAKPNAGSGVRIAQGSHDSRQGARIDSRPEISHKFLIIIKIMHRCQTRPENLATFVEVSQVRQAVIPAGVTAAFGVGRRGIVGVAGMPELDDTP